MRCLRLLTLIGLFSIAIAAVACESMQGFVGVWRGPISSDPQLQQGFGSGVELALTITALDDGDFQMSAQVPGYEAPLPFEAIRRASADALGDMTMPGDSLRSYFGYLRPLGQEPYLIVITLHSQSRIEARLIRGPDEAYGVFRLKKP